MEKKREKDGRNMGKRERKGEKREEWKVKENKEIEKDDDWGEDIERL